MTLRELEKLDISTASVETLEAAVKTAVSRLNPRIKNIGKRKNTAKNAYNAIMESGGLFSLSATKFDWSDTKRSYRNALEREVARAQRFQKASTGTVQGAMEYYKQQKSILSDMYSPQAVNSLTEDELNTLIANEWEEFHKYRDQNIGSYWTKTQRVQMLDSFKEARKTGLTGADLHEKIDEIQRKKDKAAQELARIDAEFEKATGFKM